MIQLHRPTRPRILLSLRRSLGDSVLFLRTIKLVRYYFPDADITLLVPQRYAEIYFGQPQVKWIETFEGTSFLSLLFWILEGKFDYHFDFHSSGKNLWLVRFGGARVSFCNSHSQEKAVNT